MKRFVLFISFGISLLAWQPTSHAAPREDLFPKAITKIEARIEPAEARRGEVLTWKVTIDVAPGWHTYPTVQRAPQAAANVNRIEFADTEVVVPVGKVQQPKNPTTLTEEENGTSYKLSSYQAGSHTWQGSLVVRPDAKPGDHVIQMKVRILVCNEAKCLPGREVKLAVKLKITDEEPLPIDPKYADDLKKAASPTPGGNDRPTPAKPVVGAKDGQDARDPNPAEDTQDHRASLEAVLAQLEPQKVQDNGLLAFILTGIFFGAVSLVTPCVFPMIPITVSFFLKQSEKEHHRPIWMALVYSLTIVVVLTAAAVLLLSFFRLVSIHPITNFAMGILFIVFALSLFGMFELQLPAGLAQYTSSQGSKGGVIGTVFMALTFTILSFACVAPFLGGFGGTAATTQMSWTARILGGLAFATTFASPFFVLALFPSLLRKLPKSGSWLNRVKVVMGFLELAAALVFFRTGEVVLRSQSALFTYDLVLGMWIALTFLCGLYLFNLYRLPHDTPAENLSVPQMLFGFLFISLGLYLLPAMFKSGANSEQSRPTGVVYAWINSFLLPESRPTKTGLAWTGDLKAAIDDARDQRKLTGERKLVFVDFTGKSCKNCKYNEEEVFSKPEIKDLFKPYKLVQLYTDRVPDELYPPGVREQLGSSSERPIDDALANNWFQKEAFDAETLPLYAILEPLPDSKIKVVSVYDKGKINDPDVFARFLKDPVDEAGGRTQVGMK
jgi:thiol:disulfide interchange protein DsbD